MKKIEQFKCSLEERGLSHNTVAAYVQSVCLFLKYYGSPSTAALTAYKQHLMQSCKPATVNLRIEAINSYLSYIGKPELKQKTLRLSIPFVMDNVITYQQYSVLVKKLHQSGMMQLYLMVSTMALTGVRVSELVSLNVGDFRRGYASVYGKGSKVRNVIFPTRLVREACKILQPYPDNSPAFINRRGARLSTRGVELQLAKCAERFGIDRRVMHPHSFRHMFAKQFLSHGGQLNILADLLGHEDINTTRKYLLPTSDELHTMIDDIVRW